MVELIFGTAILLAIGALLAWSSLMWWRWIVQYNRRLFDKEVHSRWPVQFEWRRLEWQELKPGEKLNQSFGAVFLGAIAAMVLAGGHVGMCADPHGIGWHGGAPVSGSHFSSAQNTRWL